MADITITNEQANERLVELANLNALLERTKVRLHAGKGIEEAAAIIAYVNERLAAYGAELEALTGKNPLTERKRNADGKSYSV